MQNQLQKTALKVGVALGLALLIIASFHKAVADDAVLAHIEPITVKSSEKLTITCGDLQKQVAAFVSALLSDGQLIGGYTEQMARSYSNWAATLTPLEDKIHAWPADYFKPIELSTKNLDSSKAELELWEKTYSDQIDLFKGAVQNCALPNANKNKMLEDLAKFSDQLVDVQASTAGFVSDMNGNLRDWNTLWHALEGTSTRVPAGYFQSLVKGADDLTEASGLFRENAQLLSERFKAIFGAFDVVLASH